MKAGRKKGEIFYRINQSGTIYHIIKKQTPEYIRSGEIRVFWLICGLLEDLDTITSKDVVFLNKALNDVKEPNTRTFINNLRKAQLIETFRESKQYFVKAYITLTSEGNLLKALIRDKVNFNPLTILEKAHKEEDKRKKEAHKKRGKTRKETFKRLRAEGRPVNQHKPKT